MGIRAMRSYLTLGLLFLASLSYADEITLYVNTKRPIAVTSERFLSLTIDPVTLLHEHFLTTDFERSAKLARALAPAYLRFAGPQSNFYALPTYSQRVPAESFNPFTDAHWTVLQQWGERSGLDVISCINPHNADGGLSREPTNSREILDLISFSDRMRYNTSWQIGYECQTRCDLSGVDLGKHVTRLRKKLSSFPRYSDSIIVGPDVVTYRSKQQQQYLQDYLSTALPALSAITWHPNFAGVTLSANGVTIHHDSLAADKEDLYKVIDRAAGRKPLWLAESKSEECKEQFLGALLWLRRLGNAAKLGAQVLMRNPANPGEPTPDYWVSLLHKTLVGRQVLEVKSQATGNKSHVHFYSQCTKPSESYERGALTVFAVNLTPGKVLASLKGVRVKYLHEYILLPGFDTSDRMFAKTVLLNNESLQLTADGDVPRLRPSVKTDTKGADFQLPSGAVGFWVIPDAKIKHCMDREDEGTEKVTRKAAKQLEEHGRAGNVQSDEDVMEEGMPNLETDERKRQRKRYQKNEEEEEEEEKKSRRNDLRRYLDILAKLFKRKSGSQEEKKPLVLKGSSSLFATNQGQETIEKSKEAGQLNKGFFFDEEINAKLGECKNKLFEMRDKAEGGVDVLWNAGIDAKTTTQALKLITEIQSGMEIIERETADILGDSVHSEVKNTTVRKENLDRKILTPDKLENVNIQIKNRIETLYKLLSWTEREGNLEDDVEVASRNSSGRSRRDIDSKIVEESTSLKKDNILKRRIKNDDTKDRRSERQSRRKETTTRESLLSPFNPTRAESNENNFHGFWRQEPLKGFPKGDIYLATGESSEEGNKDYEYVDDEEEADEKEGRPKMKTSIVDHAEPDDTWIGDGSDHLGYVPNEFFEIVNIPNVHTKENLKDYGELWEAESLQKLQVKDKAQEEDDEPQAAIVQEPCLVETGESQVTRKTTQRLTRYYQDTHADSEEDREQPGSDLHHFPNEEHASRQLTKKVPMYVSTKNSNNHAEIPAAKTAGRSAVDTTRKVKSMLTSGDDELIDFGSMHFSRDITPLREPSAQTLQYNRRHKRKIDNPDDLFQEEMIAQDDNNLKDCECRVTRDVDLELSYRADEEDQGLSRLKRSAPKTRSNEEKLQGATTTSEKPEEQNIDRNEPPNLAGTSLDEIPLESPLLQEEPDEFFRGNVTLSEETETSADHIGDNQSRSETGQVVQSSELDKSSCDETSTTAELGEVEDASSTMERNGEEVGQATVRNRESSAEMVERAVFLVDGESASTKAQTNRETQQTSKPTKRYANAKTSTEAPRATVSKRPNSKPTDSTVKTKSRAHHRAEELARILESRFAARAEALEALRRENERRGKRLSQDKSSRSPTNENTRLDDYQKRRSEILDRLREKLTTRRERILQTYRDELQRAMEATADEGKRNIKRREVWEKFRESDNFREMLDREKLAYVLTYKPIDYTPANADGKPKSENADKKYVAVTEYTRPLRQVRDRIVNFRSSPRTSYDPSILSHSDYTDLGTVKYPSMDEIIKSRDEQRNSERGSGKVYYSIVENVDEPRIFEYQPKAKKVSKPQESKRHQLVYRLNNAEGTSPVPVKEQSMKVLSYVPKPSGKERLSDKTQNLFTPEERIQIIRFLNNIEEKPAVSPSRARNLEALPGIFYVNTGDTAYGLSEDVIPPQAPTQQRKTVPTTEDRVISVPESIFTTEELDIIRRLNDPRAYTSPARQLTHDLPENIRVTEEDDEEMDNDSEEDSGSYSREDSSSGRRIYVIDPSAYRGGDPILEVHQEEGIGRTGGEKSESENLYEALGDARSDRTERLYEIIEQPKIPNRESLKVLDTKKQNDDAKSVTNMYSANPSYTLGRRDTQHTDTIDESPPSIVEDRVKNEQGDDRDSSGQVGSNEGEPKETENAPGADVPDDYVEKTKRTAAIEDVSIEREVESDADRETRGEPRGVEHPENTETSSSRKKRSLRNPVKDEDLEWIHPLASIRGNNQITRNTKPLINKSADLNADITESKRKALQLVKSNVYYKPYFPLDTKVRNTPTISEENARMGDYLSWTLRSQIQENRDRMEDEGKILQKITGVITPLDSRDDRVITSIKIVDGSSESEERSDYTDSGEGSSSSSSEESGDLPFTKSESSEQRAVLVNVSGEEEFEAMLRDARKKQYRGKKLAASEFPHLYDILKRNKKGAKPSLMMFLPLENEKINRHRREIVIEASEPGKNQERLSDNSISVTEDVKSTAVNRAAIAESRQNKRNDKEDTNDLSMNIGGLRRKEQLVPEYIADKPSHGMDRSIKSTKYETPVEIFESSLEDVKGNSLEADLNNIKNNRQTHVTSNRERVEDLSSYLENGIPKVENVITGGLEKVKKFTGSVEHFIDDFDEEFNNTLSPNERRKILEGQRVSTPTQNAFNSAIINVRNIFTFLSSIIRLFLT